MKRANEKLEQTLELPLKIDLLLEEQREGKHAMNGDSCPLFEYASVMYCTVNMAVKQISNQLQSLLKATLAQSLRPCPTFHTFTELTVQMLIRGAA